MREKSERGGGSSKVYLSSSDFLRLGAMINIFYFIIAEPTNKI